jgi:uncharacterized membrane protein
MMNIKNYLVAFTVFIVIDLIWLVFIARNLYKNQIGHLMADSPNWFAAIIFYLVFLFGLTYFVINPAVDVMSFKKVLLNGMLFGFITYATYDLTNLATLQDWPLKITIIDLLWGTSLGGAVSAMTYWIVTR